MSIQKRSPASKRSTVNIGSGPYLARIVNHLDPSFMGSLEVTLLREQANKIGEDQQTFVVKCAMPFFGYTAFEFMGQNSADKSSTLEAYNDTQKSYGMWFIPPDVGVTVLVVFVDGDPSQGYWIGCVPSNFSNHMVPAIGGSKAVDIDANDKKKYNTTQPLPVAEINRRLNTKTTQEIDPEKIKKPVHPIADRFLEQGLLDDDVRGTTTTSARREVPSMVFGISTPGPRDKRPNAKRANIGTRASQTISPVPVSRLGGTQIVMDDGDERYVRSTPAGKGPVKYIDLINGTDLGTGKKTTDKGDPTIPYNEYFRIRTRTGHQILMHNSEDLIYIGNARGTTWVELTSNGKIDIYAEDSISIHTEQDLNIRADRDINMEAGRNINMKAADDNVQYSGQGGRIRQEAVSDWEVLAKKNGKINIKENNFDIYVGDPENGIGGNTKITTSNGSFEVNTNGSNKLTTKSNTHIKSDGQHVEEADKIHMNGPPASAAAPAANLKELSTYNNIRTDSSLGWQKKYLDPENPIKSIMKRIPMHEPWPFHENRAPQQLTPESTDRGKE